VGDAVRADLMAAGPLVIVATTGGQVYGIDAATGVCRWGYRTAGSITGTVGVVGDRLLVPCHDGIVYGLSATDGTARYGVRCAGPCTTPVAGSVTAFAVIDQGGVLRVHRADDGVVVVERPVAAGDAAGVVLFPAAGPTGAVVETGAGDLIALDLPSGEVRFRLPTGEGNRSRPVVSGGIAVVGTTFGQVYGIVLP
jgi:outer membrane protein assembly factor BamB